MARPTTPLGSSRLILTLAVMVSLSFGAAVLAPATEQEETASGSLTLQATGLERATSGAEGRDSNPGPDNDITTSSTVTTLDVDTTQVEMQLPKVTLPANPRETRTKAAVGASTTTVVRAKKPTPKPSPPPTTTPPKVERVGQEPGAPEPKALVDDAVDAPLASTTTTVPLPNPRVPTTLVEISKEPASDPQRCTVRLTDDSRAQVTWSGATAPNGYEIRRNNVVIGSAPTSATSYTDSSLSKRDTEYHFSVSAIGSGDKTWCGFVVIAAGVGATPADATCRSWKDPDDDAVWWIAVSNTGADASLVRNGTVIADVSDARPQATVSDRPATRPTYEVRNGVETLPCV